MVLAVCVGVYADDTSASTDVIEVAYSKLELTWQDLGYNEWEAVVENDNYKIAIDIFIDNGTNIPTGTYTTDNYQFDTYYCYLQDKSSQSKKYFKSCTATVTADGTDYLIDANIVTTDNVAYHVVYNPSASSFNPTKTVDVDPVITSIDLTTRISKLVFTGNDKTFTLEYGGNFGEFNTFSDASGYTDAANNFCGIHNGTLSVDLDKDNNVVVTANLVCNDTIIYNIREAKKPLEVTGTKNVECHNLAITNFMGARYIFTGSSDDDYTVKAYMNDAPAEGDFANEMTFAVYSPDGNETKSLYTKSATLSKDENGEYVLDAEFIGADFADYTIKLDVVKDTAKVDVEATVSAIEFKEDASKITLKSDDKTFTFVYDGTFGEFDTFGEGSGYTDGEGKSCTIEKGTLNVDLDDENNIVVSANILCSDVVKYNILETKKPLVAADSKSISCDNLEVAGSADGIYTLSGSNDDKFSVVAAMDKEPVEGDFAADMTFAVTLPDGTKVNSLIVKSATISKDEDDKFVLDAEFMGYDMVDYTVKLFVKKDTSSINAATMGSEAKSGKFIVNNRMVILHNGNKLNALGQMTK